MGVVIDTFRTPVNFPKGLLKKVQLKQAPVTAFHIRKADLSIMFFQVTLFCCPMFKKYTM